MSIINKILLEHDDETLGSLVVILTKLVLTLTFLTLNSWAHLHPQRLILIT